MIPFLAATAVLCVVSLGLLLRPLFRGHARAPEPRLAYDLRLYRDQLAEVERDRARGLLGAEEAEASRVEIKRRMLGAAGAVESAAASPEPAVEVMSRLRGRRWAGVLAVFMPLIAALLYLELGAFGLPDEPLSARRASEVAAADAARGAGMSLDEAAAQLAKRMQERPDDPTGWLLLGRAYLSLGRPADAVEALEHARALAPDRPEILAAWIDAATAVAEGRIDDRIRAALEQLLALRPDDPKARFMLALDKARQGDLAGAAQGWTDLLAITPPDAPWRDTVLEHLRRAAQEGGIDLATLQPTAEARALAERLAAESPPATGAPAGPDRGAEPGLQSDAPPGPAAADMAAAARMSPEDRARMIHGMVDRLAARLQENPDDVDGWRRLARAYEVLGETDKAREARARVAALERP